MRSEWMDRPEERISYTITSVGTEDGGEEGARNSTLTLGIVNNADRHVEDLYPDVRCGNGREEDLVLSREEARGEYPSGLEPGEGTLGMTMEIGCEFSEPTYPEDLVVTVPRKGEEVTFVDPVRGVDRMKWRHEFDA
ncbi:hypothetical protein J0910_14205 [Nocardiopsis sp. CNT-189]|uniref:hypothetical protein n=1 Tax=Nocardiopsis oceanisediminis TaxID=2816862 RepID=UPI003B3550AD